MEAVKDLVEGYVKDRSPAYGWQNPNGDSWFSNQRQRADNTDKKQRHMFFSMMRNLGLEMQTATSALKVEKEEPQILDVCAAPGGFLKIALELNPTAQAHALTLPINLGGHHFLLCGGMRNRVSLQFLDITKLGLECGLSPEEMTDDMSLERPYLDVQCDLAFCAGQILRTNQEFRDETVENHAPRRLRLAQLIIAMNRLRSNGTLIMLLHKVEAVGTFDLLAKFHTFSDIQLFKPSRIHATRSSFYLVARNVQPDSAPAQATMMQWRSAWKETCRTGPAVGQTAEESARYVEEIRRLLETFGEKFIEIATPIWDVQSAAVESAPWFQEDEQQPVASASDEGTT